MVRDTRPRLTSPGAVRAETGGTPSRNAAINIMKTITRTETICKFSELSEEHKNKALEHFHDWNTRDSFWQECTIEDSKTIAGLMGITIGEIYFSGFSSQGDGACFTGSFSYSKRMVQAVKRYAPQDKELHRIAAEIQELHRLAFYTARGCVTHSGHYYHERSMSVSIDAEKGKAEESDWIEAFADFASWIYRQLENEYDYQSSPEAIAESLEANEMEFTIDENGDLIF